MVDEYLADLRSISDLFCDPKSTKKQSTTKLESNAKEEATRTAKEAPMRVSRACELGG